LAPARNRPQTVVAHFELEHRGEAIHRAMTKRRQQRRARRTRNLRHRRPRWRYARSAKGRRPRKKGWPAPSIRHRVDGIINLARKLMRLAPISLIIVEDSKFDTQAMANPEISGKQYQRGTLFQRHVMEYLLKKYSNRCVYCGAEHVPLEIDHVEPISKKGTSRISNLVICCRKCNQRKGSRSLEEFLAHNPKLAANIRQASRSP
jgi:5-methylcytosine-specific restriction endonuclease McrA